MLGQSASLIIVQLSVGNAFSFFFCQLLHFPTMCLSSSSGEANVTVIIHNHGCYGAVTAGRYPVDTHPKMSMVAAYTYTYVYGCCITNSTWCWCVAS